jgi:hypothetical protein
VLPPDRNSHEKKKEAYMIVMTTTLFPPESAKEALKTVGL